MQASEAGDDTRIGVRAGDGQGSLQSCLRSWSSLAGGNLDFSAGVSAAGQTIWAKYAERCGTPTIGTGTPQ